MKTKNKIPHLILAGLFGTSLASQADIVVWDGSTDTNWSASPDGTSWSGGTYNDGDDAQFNGTGSTVSITGFVTPGSITINDNANPIYTFADGTGEIQGTGGLTKTGTARFDIATGVANYTGDTNIDQGALRIVNSGGADWDAGAININNGSTLQIDNSVILRANDSITFDSSGGGLINNLGTTGMRDNTIITTGGSKNTMIGNVNGASGGRSVIFDVAVGTDAGGIDMEVSADMNNNGITKNGAGTLALTDAVDSMGGDLIVNGGTVLVEGDYTFGVDGVTVNSGATLGGSGSIAVSDPLDNVTINGTISPGSSPGTLTITGDVVWNDGADYLWEINASDIDGGGTKGTDPGWDWLDITGTLDLTNLSAGGFTIDIDSLTGALAGDAAGFDTFLEDGLEPGDHDYSFIIASATNISGFSASLFTLDDSGFSNFEPDFGWSWDIVQNGNDLVLQAYAVPEPSSTALLGLGGLALMLRRKRS